MTRKDHPFLADHLEEMINDAVLTNDVLGIHGLLETYCYVFSKSTKINCGALIHSLIYSAYNHDQIDSFQYLMSYVGWCVEYRNVFSYSSYGSNLLRVILRDTRDNKGVYIEACYTILKNRRQCFDASQCLDWATRYDYVPIIKIHADNGFRGRKMYRCVCEAVQQNRSNIIRFLVAHPSIYPKAVRKIAEYAYYRERNLDLLRMCIYKSAPGAHTMSLYITNGVFWGTNPWNLELANMCSQYLIEKYTSTDRYRIEVTEKLMLDFEQAVSRNDDVKIQRFIATIPSALIDFSRIPET